MTTKACILFFALMLFVPSLSVRAEEYEECQHGSASSALCIALDATVRLKLQANLADNKKAEQLAAQAEKLVLKALGLATNAEKLLSPIPVP